MLPIVHSAPSWQFIGHLLNSASALFAEKRQPAETLRSLDARTLTDIGIAHVGQGPESLHLEMTDTRRQDVKKSVDEPTSG